MGKKCQLIMLMEQMGLIYLIFLLPTARGSTVCNGDAALAMPPATAAYIPDEEEVPPLGISSKIPSKEDIGRCTLLYVDGSDSQRSRHGVYGLSEMQGNCTNYPIWEQATSPKDSYLFFNEITPSWFGSYSLCGSKAGIWVEQHEDAQNPDEVVDGIWQEYSSQKSWRKNDNITIKCISDDKACDVDVLWMRGTMYHRCKEGVYRRISPGVCAHLSAWKHEQLQYYILHSKNTGYWMLSDAYCGEMAGAVVSSAETKAPHEAQSKWNRKWKEWNGNVWEDNTNMKVSCGYPTGCNKVKVSGVAYWTEFEGVYTLDHEVGLCSGHRVWTDTSNNFVSYIYYVGYPGEWHISRQLCTAETIVKADDKENIWRSPDEVVFPWKEWQGGEWQTNHELKVTCLSEDKKSHKIGLGVGLGLVLPLVAVIGIILFILYKRRASGPPTSGGTNLSAPSAEVPSTSQVDPSSNQSGAFQNTRSFAQISTPSSQGTLHDTNSNIPQTKSGGNFYTQPENTTIAPPQKTDAAYPKTDALHTKMDATPTNVLPTKADALPV